MPLYPCDLLSYITYSFPHSEHFTLMTVIPAQTGFGGMMTSSFGPFLLCVKYIQ